MDLIEIRDGREGKQLITGNCSINSKKFNAVTVFLIFIFFHVEEEMNIPLHLSSPTMDANGPSSAAAKLQWRCGYLKPLIVAVAYIRHCKQLVLLQCFR